MSDPQAHTERVQRLADRLRAQGVPVEPEEGVVIVTSSDDERNHTTQTITEDGVTSGHDVVLDPIDPNPKEEA